MQRNHISHVCDDEMDVTGCHWCDTNTYTSGSDLDVTSAGGGPIGVAGAGAGEVRVLVIEWFW